LQSFHLLERVISPKTSRPLVGSRRQCCGCKITNSSGRSRNGSSLDCRFGGSETGGWRGKHFRSWSKSAKRSPQSMIEVARTLTATAAECYRAFLAWRDTCRPDLSADTGHRTCRVSRSRLKTAGVFVRDHMARPGKIALSSRLGGSSACLARCRSNARRSLSGAFI
jgi:hypothetical protein